MTEDHNESMKIGGTHDWPALLVVALREIAGVEDQEWVKEDWDWILK